MKINPGLRPFGKELKVPEHSTNQHISHRTFADSMQQHEVQASMEELQRKLKQIAQQADRLSKMMTVRELRQYKLLIKQFLEETAKRGIHLKDTRGWDRRGRSKRYKLLEEIDQTLLDMADEMLENEQGRIEILNKIGEIRGLLINLLF